MTPKLPQCSKSERYTQVGNPVRVGVEAQGFRFVVRGHRLDEQPERAGNRQPVMGFSASSRKALMGKLLVLGYALLVGTGFLTLTWSDNVLPSDGHEVKRLLHVFCTRFRRAFPGGWLIWKLEIKRRKMGAFVGLPVAHLHLVVGGYGVLEARFRAWAVQTWMDVNCNDNPDAWEHGVKFRDTYGGYRGVVGYLTKYMGKRVEREIAQEYGWMGRCWGIVGRENLPVVEAQRVSVERPQAVHLRRLARSWLRSRGASGRRYAARIARQAAEYGYELWGLPSSEAVRMVGHACELAYGGARRLVVEHWAIVDWSVELQDVTERGLPG